MWCSFGYCRKSEAEAQFKGGGATMKSHDRWSSETCRDDRKAGAGATVPYKSPVYGVVLSARRFSTNVYPGFEYRGTSDTGYVQVQGGSYTARNFN